MERLELENTTTHEIQVVRDDGTIDVVKEYENDDIPADDMLNIITKYKDCPDTVGIRIIKTVTNYNIVEIPF